MSEAPPLTSLKRERPLDPHVAEAIKLNNLTDMERLEILDLLDRTSVDIQEVACERLRSLLPGLREHPPSFLRAIKIAIDDAKNDRMNGALLRESNRSRRIQGF